MSPTSNFTIKEWLSLHCSTKDIDELCTKAMKNNDEIMAVLSLAELIKRKEIDLVTSIIIDAVRSNHLADDSHFSTVIINTLARYGDRDAMLRRFGKYFNINGAWPKTTEELLEGTMFAKIERPAIQNLN